MIPTYLVVCFLVFGTIMSIGAILVAIAVYKWEVIVRTLAATTAGVLFESLKKSYYGQQGGRPPKDQSAIEGAANLVAGELTGNPILDYILGRALEKIQLPGSGAENQGNGSSPGQIQRLKSHER